MFLLILESIGTSELILIAAVALIVFGPRKLPEMAKKLGKTMAEFRNATNEFKSTWEREVAFEDEKSQEKNATLLTDTVVTNTIAQPQITAVSADSNLAEPKVRQLSEEEAKRLFQKKDEANDEMPEATQPETKVEPPQTQTKKDWL